MYNMQHLIMICSIAELLFAIPAGMILKRMGFSSWWALLCFVPVVALFALWLLAFVKWPRDAAAQVINAG
jgi:branched-subunit amino acid transport protein